MAKRRPLPTGEIGEFPDDMSDQEIESVIQKQFPPETESQAAQASQTMDKPQQPPEQQHGLYEDYIKRPLQYEAGLGLGLSEGFADSLASIANLFPQAYEKLTGKKAGRVPHPNFMQYAPDSPEAQLGGSIGRPIGGIAAPGGAIVKGTSKVIKAAPMLKQMPAFLRNVLSGMSAGGALSEGERKKGALIGGLASSIPGIYQTGKKITEKAYRPIKEHQTAEKAKDALEKSLFEKEGQVAAKKEAASDRLNEMISNHEKKLANTEQKLEKHLPQVSEKEAKKTMSDYFRAKRTELKQNFDKRYGDFKQSSGYKPVKEPYEAKEIDNLLGKADKGAAKLGEEISPGKYKSDIINAETGKPYVFETPPEKATVQDHIEFGRQLRDARADLQSELSDATTAERLSMFDKIDRLKNIEKINKDKVQNSLDPTEWKKFQEIQEDYKNLYVPTKQINSVKGILNKNEVKGDILDDLNQPAYEKFYDHLSQDKGFNKAITQWKTRGDKHPLSAPTDSAKASALSKKLREWDDLYDHFTPEQKKHMGNYREFATKMEALKKTLGKVKSSEFDRRLRQSDVRNLLSGVGKDEAKEVESLLNRISKDQIETGELSKKAKQLGFKVNDLKEAAEKRQRLMNRLYTGLISGGVTITGVKTLK